MKKQLKIVVGAVIALLVIVTAILVFTKLDTTVPTVRFKFISTDSSKEQQVEYSYSYQGSDLIRGGKFGGYGSSETKIAMTGQIIEIPVKRIISYWPFSRFTYVLINGDQIKTSEGYCSWTSSVWNDEFESLLGDDASKKENVTGYPYLTNSKNEFLFANIEKKVIEIKCL